MNEANVRHAFSDKTISRLILDAFVDDLRQDLELDVAIAGAGPAGVTAARFLAVRGLRVAVFERNLHVGGGMWGGGMLMPRIVIQEEARGIVEDAGVTLTPREDGLFTADSVECACRCAAAAIEAGARIWVGVAVEDVVIREGDVVSGVVVNWGAVEAAGLHVDPLALESKVVIDATGHPAEICRRITEKIPGAKMASETGDVVGERPMCAAAGEAALVQHTREVYPGVIAAGMAVNAVFGLPRMGAIFGGMFLSGKRAAELAAAKCAGTD
ncbi:MAG: sulfide-dependent adenosine diphosphate thiazole synthase [Armatimonadota bacterium]